MVEYKLFSPTNQALVLDQRQFRFRFGTSNELWQIRTEPVPEGDFPYVDASSDGTNTYLIIKIGERALSQADSRIDRAKIADVIAEVYPADFPPPRREPINPVWLAYCASHHLATVASSGKNAFRPLWHYPRPAMYLLDYSVRASFSTMNTNPFILRAFTEFCDGAEYDIAPGRIPALVQIYRYPGPYSSGYPRAKYQVTQVTNVAGCTFPKEFTLQTLAPRQHGTSVDDVVPRCQYDGTLESFTYGQSDLKIGQGLKPLADVVDYRTLKLNPPRESVVYQATNNHWMAMAPGFLPYETYRVVGMAEPIETTASRSRKRTIIVVLMVGLTVMPLAFVTVKALLFSRHRLET